MRLATGLTLLLGGARSGKSDLAVRLGRQWAGSVVFAATATAGDGDMADRIARHRLDRPVAWGLVEAPLVDVAEIDHIDEPDALDETDEPRLLIVDCLTFLVANLVFAELDDDEVLAHVDRLAQRCAARPSPTLIVSNEVGMGVHPETSLGRRYRDLLGTANRVVADHADTSLLIVAGRALVLEEVEPSW